LNVTGNVAINGTSGPSKFTLTNSGTRVTASSLTFDGVTQSTGTWGSTSSGATHQDNTRFAGSGVLNVPAVATKLAITSVNGGSNPTAGTGFSVVVQAQDASGNAANVVLATGVTLSRNTGTGTLGGTLTGTISAGSSSVTISGVTYTKAESGVILTATRTSGDVLTAGNSSAFTVNAGAATKLAFTTQPGGGTGGTTWTTQPAVTLQDANSNTVTGTAQNVTLAIQTNAGPGGILSGTLTVAVNTVTGRPPSAV
jgi:hypothetical protein